MKYLPSLLLAFMRQRGVRRNMSYLLQFVFMLLVMIAGYSVLFHYLMLREGQEHSWITGVYWVLTVMSTLGFGDVTFASDLGRLFSIVVLVSGVIFFLVMLPFVFIQHFYVPWLETQKREQTPRSLPENTRGHVIMVGVGPLALNVADDLTHCGLRCVLLCGDAQQTLDLIDQGYEAVVGEYDDGKVYRGLRAEQAAMLVALDTDVRNTNVVFSAREVAPRLPIVARVENPDAADILQLAGSTRVFRFRKLLGEALARRVLKPSSPSCELGRFGRLVVVEAPVMRTSLVGKTLRECGLRRHTGANVVGLWERGVFSLPGPDTRFQDSTVLVAAGTEAQVAALDRFLLADAPPTEGVEATALILGGGQVGRAVTESLAGRGIRPVLVDKKRLAAGSAQCVQGDAADLAVLEEAGLRTTPSVLITTHDDDTNIYLTIYCRRLRPDVQIISRANLDRNVGILHAAGADLVLSLATMMSNTLINLLAPGRFTVLNEGLYMFRSTVRGEPAGKSLMESGIRSRTNCNVVAVRTAEGRMYVNPDPQYVFAGGDEVYLIGDAEAENAYRDIYGRDPEPAVRDLHEAFG